MKKDEIKTMKELFNGNLKRIIISTIDKNEFCAQIKKNEIILNDDHRVIFDYGDYIRIIGKDYDEAIQNI